MAHNEESKLAVTIRRDAELVLFPFTDYFRGFEKLEAVKKIFGGETKKVLANLKVEFFSSRWGYMSTSDIDGHLIISSHQLKNSKFDVVYLDAIHELCHVKQFMDGRVLFDSRYEYVDSPIEIEAYKSTVEEAIRIGMPRAEIKEYLKVDWIDEKELERLAKNVGL